MYIEEQIRLFSKVSSGFIEKLKITKNGQLEITLKTDKNILNKLKGTNFFFFNMYFAKLIKNCTLFLISTLVDIVIVDYPSRKDRFDIIYNFLSIRKYYRIFVIVRCSVPFGGPDNHPDSGQQFYVKSLSNLFNSSFWLERECWDLYGVFFQDNSDLRRILTDYGFEGYPLRKDFPLTGFLEVRYDDEQRSVIYENLELSQEFRFFDFESPWESINTQKKYAY